MKISIMQPYLFPYIGYFQLLNACDKFIIYDDVQYIQRGWINKNRILINKKATYFNLPLKKDKRSSLINQRFFVEDIEKQKNKFLRQIELAYKKSPNFSECYDLIQKIMSSSEMSLSKFVTNSIELCCDYLGIKTHIINSSSLNYNRNLAGQERIIEIAIIENCTHYINLLGGKELYDKQSFESKHINLSFLANRPVIYKQFNN